MSQGAEVRQGFRGGSDAVDVSVIAWSWSTLCVVVMGLRVIGVSIVLMLVWVYVVPMRELKMDVCSPIGVDASCVHWSY